MIRNSEGLSDLKVVVVGAYKEPSDLRFERNLVNSAKGWPNLPTCLSISRGSCLDPA